MIESRIGGRVFGVKCPRCGLTIDVGPVPPPQRCPRCLGRYNLTIPMILPAVAAIDASRSSGPRSAEGGRKRTEPAAFRVADAEFVASNRKAQ
jgi:hypothetical protein